MRPVVVRDTPASPMARMYLRVTEHANNAIISYLVNKKRPSLRLAGDERIGRPIGQNHKKEMQIPESIAALVSR